VHLFVYHLILYENARRKHISRLSSISSELSIDFTLTARRLMRKECRLQESFCKVSVTLWKHSKLSSSKTSMLNNEAVSVTFLTTYLIKHKFSTLVQTVYLASVITTTKNNTCDRSIELLNINQACSIHRLAFLSEFHMYSVISFECCSPPSSVRLACPVLNDPN
jgi:hypothetical protein